MVSSPRLARMILGMLNVPNKRVNFQQILKFNCSKSQKLELDHQQIRFYSPEPIRRFYADAKVVELTAPTADHPGSWGINLDRKQLRTPSKALFSVDNEAVAHVIACEWAKQKGDIMFNTMHMTALANTAQDNPFQKTKFDLCNDILSYLPMDTILYRAEEDERLWEIQKEQWDPVLYWFQDEFNVKLPIVSGAITPPEIPEETLAVIRRELMSYRFDAVLGLNFAVEAVKSLILSMAVTKLNISTKHAIDLSRVEVDFQTKHWGTLEYAHDLEYFDTMSRFSSGIMFFTLNTHLPFRHSGSILRGYNDQSSKETKEERKGV